jgi:hypothetical protein
MSRDPLGHFELAIDVCARVDVIQGLAVLMQSFFPNQSISDYRNLERRMYVFFQ